MARLAAAARSLGLVMALAACQRAMTQAPPKGVEAKAGEAGAAAAIELTSVDGAAAELDRAEKEVDQVFVGQSKRDSQASDPAAGSALSGGDGDPCVTACRALASMERAATRLCELAGEGERCDAAKARVASASERVHGACPGCGGG